MRAVDHPQLQGLLEHYHPSGRSRDIVKNASILFIVGPSGVGKDYVMSRLIKTGKFYHLVSHTTRQPRINDGVMEKNGREYYFIDLQTAIKMIENQEFIEAKIYSGNLYGTTASEIQKAQEQGKTAMTDLEVRGVAEYKKLNPNVTAVFLLPLNFEIWQERVLKRHHGAIDQADYELRLKTALNELETLLTTDYYVPVVNHDIDQTLQRIQRVVDFPDTDVKEAAEARETAQNLVQDIKKYLSKPR
jgi:guanylate kinase